MLKKTLTLTTLAMAGALVLPAQSVDWNGLDRDGDGRITRSEWRGNMRSFRQHDTNRDGVLSGTEIPGWQSRNRGGAANRLDKNNSGAVEGYEWPYNANVFHRLDTNADSVLTSDELNNLNNATLAELDRNGNRRLDADEWPGGFAQFERLDTNNDGKLSAAEYFERGGEWQRRSRFDAWDANRDGRISANEWQSNRGLFNRLDGNRDGALDWNEFTASTERYDRPFGWR